MIVLILFFFIFPRTGSGSKLFPVRTAPPDGTTFVQITLGDKFEGEIPAFGYWNVQFYHPRAAYVRFDYDFPRGASIAVYGRRNALPTHTQYEILELLNGFQSRQTRSTHVSTRLLSTHTHTHTKYTLNYERYGHYHAFVWQ